MLSLVNPEPTKEEYGDKDHQAADGDMLPEHMRVNLTSPPDRDNDLIKVAALHGPPGILALLRVRRDYAWFVVLGLRAIEVCMGPRGENCLPVLRDCDPIAFAMQMLEMEMIDEIFLLMKEFWQVIDVQRAGLAIMELLIMDDPEWRDEVVRKGGAALLCEIANGVLFGKVGKTCAVCEKAVAKYIADAKDDQVPFFMRPCYEHLPVMSHKENQRIMCQVMTCMSYLAAEDYIEVMLGQHDALEHVSHVLKNCTENIELVTRAILALLNLTVCESHVEELMDKGSAPLVLEILKLYPRDVHVAIISCGVLANLSVSSEVRQLLVEQEVFYRLADAMKLDAGNSVLQVACLKALVNYSASPEHYRAMLACGIPTLVEKAQIDHASDVGVNKYGNYLWGQHTSCPIL